MTIGMSALAACADVKDPGDAVLAAGVEAEAGEIAAAGACTGFSVGSEV